MEAFAPQEFDEDDDRAMYGKIVLATDNSVGGRNVLGRAADETKQDKTTSYATGHCDHLRDVFRQHGRLDDSADRRFRRIGDDTPVLALSKALHVTKDISTAVFAVGHVRDPLISYRATVLDEVVGLKAVHAASGASWTDDLASFFHSHRHHKRSAARLDHMIFSDASKVSIEYAKICALSVRQAFASIELTTSSKHGIQAWMKEISSDG